MDTKEAIVHVKAFADRVLAEFAPQEIVLFGSYAKGNQKELSDMDVAVIFDEYTGDRFKAGSRLWRIAGDSEAIIEPILLEARHDRPAFLREVKQHGITVYKSRDIP
jgi:predicted nucleotidyltransferase